MGLIDRLFRRHQRTRSATIARQRLVEVLVQDHVDLTPAAMEAIRRDIIHVLSRHLDIDLERLTINIQRSPREDRFVADIPVRGRRHHRRRRE